MLNYKTLYGVSLEEYCQIQGITPKELVEKIERDIKMLWENYQSYAIRNNSLTDEELYIANVIYYKLASKRQHLDDIKRELSYF